MKQIKHTKLTEICTNKSNVIYVNCKHQIEIKSGKKMTGCYSPWRLVANKLGVVSHHAR